MQLPTPSTFFLTIQGPGPGIREEFRKAAEEIRAEANRELRQTEGARRAAGLSDQTPPDPPERPVIVTAPQGEHQVFVGRSEVPPWARREEIPPEAVEMAMGFFFTMVVIVIGLPIARAFARRMDRKAVPAHIPPEITAQLGQLSQAVDAIAVEVERISEGQRYTTRLLSEQRDSGRHVLPAGSDR